MRKLIIFIFCMGLAVSTASGDPLLIEKAGNYLSAGEYEAGLNNVTYSYDKTDFEGVDRERVFSQFLVPFFVRYSLNDNVEFSADIPYRSDTVESTAGEETDSDTTSGIGNSSLLGKYSLGLENMTVSGNLEVGLHTGGDDFKQGLDIYPSISARKYFTPLIFNANAGYKLTGKYELDDGTEINEGDIILLSAGVEYPYLECLTVGAEFLYENLSSLERDGEEIADSSGARSEIIGGLRYNKGSYRTKLGIGLSLGDETYREYDYRIFTQITYRL